MPALTLHRATPADAAEYARVARETFYDSYIAMSDPAMMAMHLRRHFGEPIQRSELEDAANTLLVAMDADGSWAGFAALRRCDPPDCVTGRAPVQLQRIYATRNWHGRGAGAFLLDAALAEARAAGHDTLWLQVWERNARARRFYEKSGFAAVGTHPYQFADEWEDDLVLQKQV